MCLVLLTFLSYLFYIGLKFQRIYADRIFLQLSPISVYGIVIAICATIDFLFKSLFKKYSYPIYDRFFFKSNSGFYVVILLGEGLSCWNWYLQLFFLPGICGRVLPIFGVFVAIGAMIGLYIVQFFVSQFVHFLKTARLLRYLLPIIVVSVCATFLNNPAFIMDLRGISAPVLNAIFIAVISLTVSVSLINLKHAKYSGTLTRSYGLSMMNNTNGRSLMMMYLLLNLTMMARSPRLRYQVLVSVVVSVFYIYLINAKFFISANFSLSAVFFTLPFAIFGLIFNQNLLSAESSFYNLLLLKVDLQKYLHAKYVLYIGFTALPMLAHFIIRTEVPFQEFYLLAMYCYAIGVIVLSSFCSSMYGLKKIDLYATGYKASFVQNQAGQALVVFTCYVITLALVIGVYYLTSAVVAIWFMGVFGLLSIIAVRPWLAFVSNKIYGSRYKTIEQFN